MKSSIVKITRDLRKKEDQSLKNFDTYPIFSMGKLKGLSWVRRKNAKRRDEDQKMQKTTENSRKEKSEESS